MKYIKFIVLLIIVPALVILLLCFPFNKMRKLSTPVSAQTLQTSWYMAGANPQRTSWVAEQVPATNNGQWGALMLYPQWYTPIEGYIPHKVQIVAGNNTIFVSSANGVYAFDAAGGTLKWVFPTELPVGQSPTYFETSFLTYPKRLYIPGLDHKLYCVNADPVVSSLPTDSATNQKVNNQKCWSSDFEAGAGFETNPLVVTVGGKVMIYAGNRDMNEYAITDNGTTWTQTWKFSAAAPILFSSAISKDLTKVYFASLDNGTYAVNSTTGAFIWNKIMQGDGFYSYWPVVYNDAASGKEYVVFNGSSQYRPLVPPNEGGTNKQLNVRDRAVFGSIDNIPGMTRGTPVGPRGTDGMLDISKDYNGSSTSGLGITAYLENKPHRRTVFVLDALTGNEKSFDLNSNGKVDYAPFLWQGTQSGNRFPPIISGASGQSGFIYSSNDYYYSDWINGGGVAGWKFGTPYMSTSEPFWHAVDEPMYYAGGGNLIYWAQHQDTAAGVIDISKSFSTGDNFKSAEYWTEGSCGTSPWPCLHALISTYDSASGGFRFGGTNGNYGRNGDGNPPIPYAGKVYFQEGNALIAFGTTDHGQITTPVQTAKIVDVNNAYPQTTLDQLKQKLQVEVQKMITAGHLRPGFVNHGLLNDPFADKECGDNLQDYFKDPADTIITLAKAIPYLDTATQTQARTYLSNEFNSYSPVNVAHIGFTGVQRDYYAMLPEIAADISNPNNGLWTGFDGWSGAAPHGFYALWQYAKAMNYTAAQAASLLSANASKLKTNPSATAISNNVFVLNSYIDGYIGYTKLKEMANQLDADYNSKISTLNSLLSQRATNFTKDVAWGGISMGGYCRSYTPAKNFMYLTSELGQYLHDNALAKVQTALNEYYHNTSYWFVEGFEDSVGEWIFTPYYDTNLLLAKAYILKEPREELIKYLDTPMFKTGDLFYIQNLVAAIEAQPTGPEPSNVPSPSPSPIPVAGDINGDRTVNGADMRLVLGSFIGNTICSTFNCDLNSDGKINLLDAGMVILNFGKSY